MQITLDGWVCLLGAFLLLSLPFSWVLSAFLAALVHEMCHIAALVFTKTSVWGVRVGIGGAEIATAPLDRKTELLCSAAGPLGSLSLLALIHFFPRLALCGSLQGIFNLLPFYPMDGGRILRCLAQWLLPLDRAKDFVSAVEKITITLLLGASLFLTVPFGFLPLLVIGMTVLRLLVRKRPCKESKLAVQ